MLGCLRLPIPIPSDEISHAVAALEARLAIPGLGFIVLDGAAGASRERAAWRALRPAAAESFAREEERGEGGVVVQFDGTIRMRERGGPTWGQ